MYIIQGAHQWRNEGFQRPGARFHTCAPLFRTRDRGGGANRNFPRLAVDPPLPTTSATNTLFPQTPLFLRVRALSFVLFIFSETFLLWLQSYLPQRSQCTRSNVFDLDLCVTLFSPFTLCNIIDSAIRRLTALSPPCPVDGSLTM